MELIVELIWIIQKSFIKVEHIFPIVRIKMEML
jgi:hypothetical protein